MGHFQSPHIRANDDQIGQMGFDSMYCFDGQRWHNVTSELKWSDHAGSWHRLADGGRTLIRLGQSELVTMQNVPVFVAPLEAIRVDHGTMTTTRLGRLHGRLQTRTSGQFLFTSPLEPGL